MSERKESAIAICPGFHAPQLTQNFLDATHPPGAIVFPDSPYDGSAIADFLARQISPSGSVLLVGFSAGVVGAIAAAYLWQQRGGKVRALIAIDGWGVPLFANFPIYRLSHDEFTHWSSSLLGAGTENFYAQPDVSHLELWRSPQTAWGWQVLRPGCHVRSSAADFLAMLWSRYC